MGIKFRVFTFREGFISDNLKLKTHKIKYH